MAQKAHCRWGLASPKAVRLSGVPKRSGKVKKSHATNSIQLHQVLTLPQVKQTDLSQKCSISDNTCIGRIDMIMSRLLGGKCIKISVYNSNYFLLTLLFKALYFSAVFSISYPVSLKLELVYPLALAVAQWLDWSIVLKSISTINNFKRKVTWETDI